MQILSFISLALDVNKKKMEILEMLQSNSPFDGFGFLVVGIITSVLDCM